MNVNRVAYRFVAGLLTLIFILSMGGDAVLAETARCPCCGDMAQAGHLRVAPAKDCCHSVTCAHCTVSSGRQKIPPAAIIDSGSTGRQNILSFLTAQTFLPNAIDRTETNFLPEDPLVNRFTKIPLYLHLKTILC